MEVPRKQVQKVCSEAEYDLIKSSYESGARSPKPQRLKEKVKLVRKLRDKYRDLARREVRKARRRSLSTPDIDAAELTPDPRPTLVEYLRAKRMGAPLPRPAAPQPVKPPRVIVDAG